MDAKTPRRGRRTAEEAARTREVILTAAMRLFAERGFDAVSLRDIAVEADSAHGLIRHYFGTKEQVWQAVLERADAEFTVAMRAVLDAPAGEDPVETIRHVVRVLTSTSAEHPEIVRLLLGEGTRGGPRLRQIIERLTPLRSTVRDLLPELQAQGRFTGVEPDTFVMVLLLGVAGPFALSSLAEGLTGRNPLSAAFAEQHTGQIMTLLFPEG
ncbi:TetR/AcrR family transcriptional regulator [Saccharopolyspora taberi]|uniref:HTH tetR-type domain-containing protein n=1 Tax=Saccharopolyspora taberi TaxID=60895 RepID=A0ABN3VIQ5_9PSEU